MASSIFNKGVSKIHKTGTTGISATPDGYYICDVNLSGIEQNRIIGFVTEDGTTDSKIFYSNAYIGSGGLTVRIFSKTPSSTVNFSVVTF